MALDHYQPCLCGSGKKLKFCCGDLAPELEKIDRMIQKVEIAIEKLTEYRAALITAAVTGKIDVRHR